MKVLLISANSLILNKVSGVISSGHLTGRHRLKIMEIPPADPNGGIEESFLIADLCSNSEQDNGLLSFLKGPAAADFPKLLIINDKIMLSGLLKDSVKISDFVFKDNLDSELEIRIENIFLRDFKLNSSRSMVFGDMVLDLDKYQLLINGKRIELTFKEYQLLKMLLENKNKVFNRSQLLSAVWDYDYYGGSRTVDVHIRRLRSKMDLPYSDMLKTIRNVGYMFCPELK